MEYDYRGPIDILLGKLSEETASKIWKVVITLNSTKEILDQDKFIVPYEKLRHDSSKYEGLDDETVTDILGMMHQMGIVTLWTKIDTADFSNPGSDRIIETPFGDDGVLFEPDTKVAFNTESFQYLYSRLKEMLKAARVKGTQKLNCQWQPNQEKNCGILTLLEGGNPFIFKRSYFGGINEFFKSRSHTVAAEKLKKAIADTKQGAGKKPGEIKISKWKFELKKAHPRFLDYFSIEFSPPDIYRLTRKTF